MEKGRKINSTYKIIIAILMLIVSVILLWGYNHIKSYMSSPMRAVEIFEEAIVEGDSKKLSSILECNLKKLEINKESVEIVLDYFKDDPSYFERVIWILEKEAKTFGDGSEVTELKDASEDVFYFDMSKKSILGIRECKVFIRPVFIELKSRAEGVKFLMNDEEICTSEFKDFKRDLGPFMPGNYKLTYQYNNEFVALEESIEFDFIKEGKVSTNQLSYEIAPQLRYVTLKINDEVKNADVYIDGQKIDEKAGEVREFGPLSERNKIYIELDSNGERIKSEESEVGVYEKIYIDLGI